MDPRQKLIVEEACKIIENLEINKEGYAFKSEQVLKSLAQIIRLAIGSQVGGQ